ncbi:MAG: 30S ribosomal protein S16 [Candidatus Omnitrophota bacterium]
MAVAIRLKRMGTKKKPHHKIIVCDSRIPRDGRAIEEIGYYDPSKQPAAVNVKAIRAKFWLDRGAVPSDTVKSIFRKMKIL